MRWGYNKQAINYVKICSYCGCEIYYSMVMDKKTREVLLNYYPSCCPNCFVTEVKNETD